MNLSNILDSARQYFQGLPSAQQGDPGGGAAAVAGVTAAPASTPPAPSAAQQHQQVFVPPQAKSELRWPAAATTYPSTGAKLGSYPPGASRTPPYTPPSAGKASPYAAPPQQSKSPAVPASFYQQPAAAAAAKGLTSLPPSSSPSPAYYKSHQQFYSHQFNSRGLPQVFETSKSQPVAVAKTSNSTSAASSASPAALAAANHVSKYPQINPLERNSFAQQYYPQSKQQQQHFYPSSYASTSSAATAAPPVVASAAATPSYPTMATPTSWMSSFGQQQRQAQQQQQHQQQLLQQQQHNQLRPTVVNHANEQKKSQQQQPQQSTLQPPKVPPSSQKPRPGVRRDSPLDLSVRTIRRSADSTHDDEAAARLHGGPVNSEMARADTTQSPRSSQPTTTNEQSRVDLSLQSLLRSQEALPNFRPSFVHPNYSSESEKAREAMAVSSLLSLEHKFGPQQPKQAVPPSSPAPQPPANHHYHHHQQHHPQQQPQPPVQQPPPQHHQQQSHHPHHYHYQQQQQHQVQSSQLHQQHPQHPQQQQQTLPNIHHFLPNKSMENVAPAYNHMPPTSNSHHQSPQQFMYNQQQMNYQQYYQHKANASQAPSHPSLAVPKANHSAADKRILSILRNSLETKNANQRLLAEAAAANQQQHPAVRMQLPPSPHPPHPHHHHQARPSAPKTHNQVPHLSQAPFAPNAPQPKSPDADGLAALVAARIRTKAELKQLGGDFQQNQLLSPTVFCGRCSHHGCVCQKCRVCPEGVPCTCLKDKSAAPVMSRKVSDTRSSTETSVFDFPDSDPEISAPTSVSDLRKNRKAPNSETPTFSEPPPLSPAPKLEEVDPEWASICSTFVVSLETKGSKVRAAQHSFHAARKRKQQQEERLKAKFIKLEQQTKETPQIPVENGIEPVVMPLIQPKLEPVDPVEPEVVSVPLLIPKVLDEEEKSVLSDSSSEALPVRLRKKVQLASSSESDYEEELTLAERQAHRRRVVNSSSSTEQSESSTEESDWSDDVGKTVSGRLRTARAKGRNYNTRKTKGSKVEGVKTRRGRRRIKSTTSSDEEEEVEDNESDSSSESPEPRRRTRRTAQRSKSSSRSPSPVIRKTRNSKPSKKQGTKKEKEVVETAKVAEVKTVNNKTPKTKVIKEKKEKENKTGTKKGAKIIAAEKLDKNISENSQDNGFYPGWESELVKFKQSLRMPSNLIRVHSRPNSDPPTPTKKRRGVTNSPISDCGTRGKKCDPETPIRKKVIRDVELSDSSCSMPGRPRKKNEKVSQDVLKKLATKLKSKVGALKKALKTEQQQAESKKEVLPPRRGLRKRRRSSRLSGNMERRHLRSAAQQRSNRILINSKKHLRRRDMKVKVKQEGTTPKPEAAKKPPGRGRRKLRSSGFDYLRKRKKKKEGSDTSSISKKPGNTVRLAKSVEEIANEVRGWVVNKGLGETVLHRAARASRCDVAAYCLENLGMDPSAKDNAGYTPLHVSCARGHINMVRLLLMYGAVVDSSAQGGIRPLHEASECGHIEIIRLLLSFGADPLLFNYAGQTSMDMGSPEAQKLLREHLDDIQGKPTPSWEFESYVSLDPVENGFNVFEDAPSPEPLPIEEEMPEMEDLTAVMGVGISPFCLPATFWVKGERDTFMLLSEVCQQLGHSAEWLKKSLKSEPRTLELSKCQFLEKARCAHLLGANWSPDPRKLKPNLTLVRVDKELRRLLTGATLAAHKQHKR